MKIDFTDQELTVIVTLLNNTTWKTGQSNMVTLAESVINKIKEAFEKTNEKKEALDNFKSAAKGVHVSGENIDEKA
jgi:hypothetical protein